MIQLISLIFALIFSGPKPAQVSVSVAKRALNSSVLVHMKTAPDKDGKRHRGGCSGTYIDPTHIISAAHCFDEDTEFIWARGLYDKVGYPVKVVRYSKAKDLALLEAPYAHPYATLGRMPERGESILNVGSPLMFEFVVSEGILAMPGYRMKQFTATYLVTTAMINPGSSGGGAFNSQGQLVGVNTMSAGFMGWDGISLAVSVNDVREFIRYLGATK